MVAESNAPQFTTQQLVDQITTYNPTASPDFLARFSPANLLTYLQHLIACQEPRGRSARWIRPSETPAIMGWAPGV